MTRFIALLGALCISFSAIWVGLAGVAPTTAAFFRTAYAVPILLVVWLLYKHKDRRVAKERWLALSAGVLLALDFVLWHYAIELIGAGLSTVLANTQVIFVGLLAWLIYRERPTWFAFLTVPLVFAGIVLLSGLGRADAYGANPVAGVAFGVLTGIAYTGFLLIFRASNRGLAPPAGPLLDATLGAMACSLFIGVSLDPHFDLSIHWPAHLWLLALALGSQVIGWLCIATALPRLPALETSIVLLIQPMASVLWGYLIFAEYLSVIQWLGVSLVLAGVGALSLLGSVERPAQHATAVD